MPETEVRCTCTDFEANAGCAVHGVAMAATQALAERESRREMAKGAELIRRRVQAWMEIPQFRAVVMEVAIEDVKRRGPVVVNEAARTIAAHLPPIDLNRALYGEPLIVRATPEQRAALAEARDPQAEINARGNRVMEWLSQGEVGWVPQAPQSTIETLREQRFDQMVAAGNSPEAVASAVIGTFRTPPAPGLYRAPTRPVECTLCQWKGREFHLIAPPSPGTAASHLCPKCRMASGLVLAGQQTPAAPVAACTAHVTAAPATPVDCDSCGWSGTDEGLKEDDDVDSGWACPECGGDAEKYVRKVGEAPKVTVHIATPLDAAIRGSASLDPGGDRKPADQLLVETFDQAEARRKVDAERIASIMKGGGL